MRGVEDGKTDHAITLISEDCIAIVHFGMIRRYWSLKVHVEHVGVVVIVHPRLHARAATAGCDQREGLSVILLEEFQNRLDRQCYAHGHIFAFFCNHFNSRVKNAVMTNPSSGEVSFFVITTVSNSCIMFFSSRRFCFDDPECHGGRGGVVLVLGPG